MVAIQMAAAQVVIDRHSHDEACRSLQCFFAFIFHHGYRSPVNCTLLFMYFYPHQSFIIMSLKSFSILVPFDGVMTMADVQEVESPLNFVYKVTFQNGYANAFTT